MPSLTTPVLLPFVGCSTSQQHTSVSRGWICSDSCTCCHTEIEVADRTFHLTQSRKTDTRPTSFSTHSITPSAKNTSFYHWYDSTWEKTQREKAGTERRSAALEADALPPGQQGGPPPVKGWYSNRAQHVSFTRRVRTGSAGTSLPATTRTLVIMQELLYDSGPTSPSTGPITLGFRIP